MARPGIGRRPPDLRAAAIADAAVPAVLTLFVLVQIFGAGLPELRHDWRWPGPDGTPPLLASWTSGWLPYGIGEGSPYPTFYLAGFALMPFARLLSPLDVAATIVGSSIFIASRAAMKLARSFDAGTLGAIACALVAALNPWVYAKEIAGHVFMVADYAVLIALWTETRRRRPRTLELALLAAFAVMQVQFVIIAAVPLTWWLVRNRQGSALVALIAAALPIAIGLALEGDAVAQIPYNLAFQRSQSVALLDGISLRGYAFPYAAAFGPDAIPLWTLVALAVAGGVLSLRSRGGALAAGATIALLLVASGTSGPLASPYAWVVANVRASGVYRELFDLIGLVAIAYVAGIAVVARFTIASIAALVAGLSLAAVWTLAPPRTWFVPASQLTFDAVPARESPSFRIAYFPAFQPLSLHGRGSGYDPDLYVRDGRATPLNEFYPTFPVDAALARAEAAGNGNSLRWFGVDRISVRPDLRSDRATLAFQHVAVGGPASGRPVRAAIDPFAVPLLSETAGVPPIVAVGDGMDEVSISAIDAGALAPIFFEPSESTLDAGAGWVDLRLAETALPDAANPYGGVVTTGSRPLDLRGARAVLAYVRRGRLVAGGKTVAVPARALRWYTVPAGARTLTCEGRPGLCAIAAGAPRVPRGPAHAASPRLVPIRLDHVYAPWLMTGSGFRPGSSGTLRFNERYDTFWLAYLDAAALPHVRLDGIVNGYALPAVRGSGEVVLVHGTSAIMFLCELGVVAYLCVLGLLEWRPRKRSRARAWRWDTPLREDPPADAR